MYICIYVRYVYRYTTSYIHKHIHTHSHIHTYTYHLLLLLYYKDLQCSGDVVGEPPIQRLVTSGCKVEDCSDVAGVEIWGYDVAAECGVESWRETCGI